MGRRRTGTVSLFSFKSTLDYTTRYYHVFAVELVGFEKRPIGQREVPRPVIHWRPKGLFNLSLVVTEAAFKVYLQGSCKVHITDPFKVYFATSFTSWSI